MPAYPCLRLRLSKHSRLLESHGLTSTPHHKSLWLSLNVVRSACDHHPSGFRNLALVRRSLMPCLVGLPIKARGGHATSVAFRDVAKLPRPFWCLGQTLLSGSINILKQAMSIYRHLHSLNTRNEASFRRFAFCQRQPSTVQLVTQTSDPRASQDCQVTPPICWPSIPLSLSWKYATLIGRKCLWGCGESYGGSDVLQFCARRYSAILRAGKFGDGNIGLGKSF